MIIGYQGSKGSYSYEASNQILKNLSPPTTFSINGFTLSENVIDALKKGEINFAVLPVENSIIGNIDINTELIQKNDIQAVQEFYLKIEHVLYSKNPTNISGIEKVYSHPAALAQCHDYIKLHNLTPMVEFDTGGACQKMIKSKYPEKSAIIAGPQCRHIWNIHEVSNCIQNTNDNYTRFLLLKNGTLKVKDYNKGNKFSLSFSTNNKPGSLLEVLGYFQNFKINLTKIESMPIPETPFSYTFFIDGELDGPKSCQIKNQLEGLIKALRTNNIVFKLIGVYPKHQRNQWS